MSTPILMPKLGESVTEGTVSRWLKKPGDLIAKLEPLLEISTDKIDTELPAPVEGVLQEIVVAEGQTVQVGTTLAYIGTQDTRNEIQNAKYEIQDKAVISSASVSAGEIQSKIQNPKSEIPSGRSFISPVVAKLAREHQLDLNLIAGTGNGGRITKQDVLAYLESGVRSQESEVRSQKSEVKSQESPTLVTHHSSLITPTADETLYPLTTMRRMIAQHMVQSKQTSPHVTVVHEVDMSAVVQDREASKASLAEKGIQLTFTPYFVSAAVKALRAVPYVNGRFTEQGIIVNRRIHIGVAVAIERKDEQGLVVPVIRDADEKNLAGLARAVNQLTQQARSGQLSPDAFAGGSFTITNYGTTGGLIGTPIINQPQSAILGVGAIVKRPVVKSGNQSLLPSADDAIVIRPMCYLSFSFDHRIIDGASADQFLTMIKQTLENWKE